MKYSAFPPKYETILEVNRANIINCANPLFFSKHSDWRDEEEYRLVGIDFPDFLSINDSICYIILGQKTSLEDIRDIVSIVNDPNTKSYKQLGEMSFVRAKSTAGSISVVYLHQCADIPKMRFIADELQWCKLTV